MPDAEIIFDLLHGRPVAIRALLTLSWASVFASERFVSSTPRTC